MFEEIALNASFYVHHSYGVNGPWPVCTPEHRASLRLHGFVNRTVSVGSTNVFNRHLSTCSLHSRGRIYTSASAKSCDQIFPKLRVPHFLEK